MKYWKGKAGTAKEGQYGTCDDNGSVPDSDEVTKSEYDSFISNIKINIPIQKNWKFLYQNAATDAEKIDIIAKFLKLK